MALKKKLKLLTFDGDETLYPDGQNFEDLDIASYIAMLIKEGINVAIVTAAGYGYQVEKYEARIKVLLDYFKEQKLSPEECRSFFLMGGESNYLLRCNEHCRLEVVPEDKWREEPHDVNEIQQLLDIAEASMSGLIKDLGLRATVLKKERAVGLVPGGDAGKRRAPKGSGGGSLKYEILEEAVQRIRHDINNSGCKITYCAFNGGRDVWVDIGDKGDGLKALQRYLQISPDSCGHIGDQFTESGNDIAARNASPTLWILNPTETKAVLRSLLIQTGARLKPESETPRESFAGRRRSRMNWSFDEQEWTDEPGEIQAAIASTQDETQGSHSKARGGDTLKPLGS
eukprot:Selendium_serpulae@DN6332_c0_g1_i17.p2